MGQMTLDQGVPGSNPGAPANTAVHARNGPLTRGRSIVKAGARAAFARRANAAGRGWRAVEAPRIPLRALERQKDLLWGAQEDEEADQADDDRQDHQGDVHEEDPRHVVEVPDPARRLALEVQPARLAEPAGARAWGSAPRADGRSHVRSRLLRPGAGPAPAVQSLGRHPTRAFGNDPRPV